MAAETAREKRYGGRGEDAMKDRRVIFAVVFLLILLQPGYCLGFYCGDRLIRQGLTTIEVLHACGQPDSVDSWDEVKNVGHFRFGFLWYSLENVHVEQWVYNFGPSRFLRLLRFENGILKRIKTGGYGFAH